MVDSHPLTVFDHPPFGNNPTFKKCALCKSESICGSKGKCLLKASKQFAHDYGDLLLLFGEKPPPVNISRGQQGTRSRHDKRRKANLLPENLTKSPAGNAKLAPAKIGKVKPHIVRAKRRKTTVYASGDVKIKKNPNTGRLEQVPGRRIVVHRKGDVIKVGGRPALERHKALPDELVDRLQKAESKVQRKIKEEKGKIVHKTKGSVHSAKASGKNLKKGATVKIREKEAVVVGQGHDEAGKPVKIEHPTERGDPDRTRESKRRESKDNKTRQTAEKRRKQLTSHTSGNDPISGRFNPSDEIVEKTMKAKNVNRRGARAFLRRIFLAGSKLR